MCDTLLDNAVYERGEDGRASACPALEREFTSDVDSDVVTYSSDIWWRVSNSSTVLGNHVAYLGFLVRYDCITRRWCCYTVR